MQREREKNAESTVGENHDREIELVRVRRRIKRNGGDLKV